MDDVDLLFTIGKDYFGPKAKTEEVKESKVMPMSHVVDAVDKILALPLTGRRTRNMTASLEEIKELCICGYSVLIHGFGSKIDVLSELVEDWLSLDHYVVRIEGFKSNLSLSRCLVSVLTQVLHQPTPRNTQVDFLASEISKHAHKEPLAFVIDSIDGPVLREHQGALATLSQHSLFVATADHLRFALLWDERTFNKFSWVFQEISTREDYRREVLGVHGNTLPAWCGLGATTENVASQSMAVVLRSLTANHTALVKMIAEMQIKEGGKHVRATDLLVRCKKQMLATTHVKLRNLLHELIDHAVVKTKKEAATGNEVFYLSGDIASLEKIVSGEAMTDNADDRHVQFDARGG